eukprot:11571223-Ditylum_brightwellii.AAC.2
MGMALTGQVYHGGEKGVGMVAWVLGLGIQWSELRLGCHARNQQLGSRLGYGARNQRLGLMLGCRVRNQSLGLKLGYHVSIQWLGLRQGCREGNHWQGQCMGTVKDSNVGIGVLRDGCTGLRGGLGLV